MKRKNERLVSIKELCWHLVLSWKSIVIVAIIIAIIMGLGQIRKNRQYNELANIEIDEVVDTSTNADKMAALEASLSDTELTQLNQVNEYTRQIEDSTNYLKNSILMNIDLYNESIYTVQYVVKGNIYNIENIDSAVIAYFNSYSWSEELTELQGLDGESVYTSELVRLVSDTTPTQLANEAEDNNRIITFRFIGVDLEDAVSLGKNFDQILQDYAKSIAETFGAFSLDIISAETANVVDASSVNARLGWVDRCASYTASRAALIASFTDGQRSLYQYRQMPEEILNQVAVVTIAEKTPTISLKTGVAKQCVVGAVIGLVLMSILSALHYLFGGKLNCSEEITDIFKLNLIGDVRRTKDGSKRKLNHARFRKCLSKTELLGITKSNLEIYCKQEGYKSIYMTSTMTGFASSDYAKDLLDALKSDSLKLEFGESCLISLEATQKMSEADGVILVESVGETSIKSLDALMAQAELLNVHFVGSILV